LFAGRVGTGFFEKALEHLYDGLEKIRRLKCPFVNLPEKAPGRWRQTITSAVMKHCAWVGPTLVAQIKFIEWTSDDQLRQPVFLGLRTDKQAKTSFGNRRSTTFVRHDYDIVKVNLFVAACLTATFSAAATKVSEAGRAAPAAPP
jgi:ATP-dependent DNA ligase